MTPLAIIEDYSDLIIALRPRQNEIGISHEILSEIAGLSDRYTNKLLTLSESSDVGPGLECSQSKTHRSLRRGGVRAISFALRGA